ncbi:uncharacterized protein TOT_040000591 [Theileria orientalis strain Shintoku]|uniref:VWFA domain-containing protein n=1 Tax=Theileria orientalis strain Shintoku TaxID=869250 RepID=J4C4I0_THEOR|nr:uncharacterized protein TOT_040000591 [Theileria orientalis strain Shintoku]BAM42221.1 uncharacterized protein TOT_040000591 [Theileria orientalis strain Shintoku]|eukprot:XP_009692522.1 uncharacterized protein TOT_040000591 [Theileria orientalis strain Shintoku]
MRRLSILFTAYMIFGLNLCQSQKHDDSRLYPTGLGKHSGHCRRELDLTLLVDESSSINQEEWDKLIIFLKSLIRSINIGPNYAHISLVTFSTSTRLLISFMDPGSKNEREALKIVDMLSKSKPAIGLTYTGQAMEYIRNSVLRFGTRKTAPKAIILITDGGSTQPGVTSQASALLRDDGVTLLVVGVKKAIDFECRSVVGCPVKKVDCPAFFKTNWDEIIRKVGNLMTEVCDTIPKDAVCRPIWSDWSPCNVKCGPGTKFKKLMDVVTVEEQTVGTNGKSGKTCKEQFVNVEQPQEECMGACTDISHFKRPGESSTVNQLTSDLHVDHEEGTTPAEDDSSSKGDEATEGDQITVEGEEDQSPENPGEGEDHESGEGVEEVESHTPEEITNEPEETTDEPEESPAEESGEEMEDAHPDEAEAEGEAEPEPSEPDQYADEEESPESVDEEPSEFHEPEGDAEQVEDEGSAAETHEEQSPEELSHEEHAVPKEHEATIGEHHAHVDEDAEIGGDQDEYPEGADHEHTGEHDEGTLPPYLFHLEVPGPATHFQNPQQEPPGMPHSKTHLYLAGDYTKHESSHQKSRKEESTKKEGFSRSGATIAGGIILGLLMLGAGGGYAYYRK